MKRRAFRIGRLTGAAALAVLTPAAHAQQGSPTPTPAPRATPNIISLPGANSFSLPSSGAQPQRPPVQQPTPTPSARPTPTPSAAAARVRATPTPQRAAERPRATAPAVQAQPTPTPAQQVQPTPLASPTAQATPPASFTATPTPVPAPAVEGQGFPWLWILAGAAMAAVLVALGWLLGRRRQRPVRQAEPVAAPEPAAAPPPPAQPAPPPPAPRSLPRPTPAESIAVELHPIAIELADTGAMLEFELIVANASAAQVEGLRVAYGLMSASELQDDLIASFHGSQVPPVAEPFDLAPRGGMRIPGKVPLTPDRINIVEVGGRPMFVPILLVDLRWRSGLSVKHQTNDYMIGMGGQGDKIGPIWLDKGAQRHTRLNATRYVPRPVTVAAE